MTALYSDLSLSEGERRRTTVLGRQEKGGESAFRNGNDARTHDQRRIAHHSDILKGVKMELINAGLPIWGCGIGDAVGL